MGNHVHLLIRICGEPLETVFKRIGGKYVYWYNVKYKRVGHLFQDRFKSEPVEDDSYFAMVLRYIHKNPVKAKLCKNPAEYRWSSYLDYLEKAPHTDWDYALGLMGLEEFKRYHEEANEDQCLEISNTVRRGLTDEQAKEIADFYHMVCDNVKTLICQCEHGQSRSAAVAAAFIEYRYKAGIEIFADDDFTPNKTIFRKIMKELQK
jgi:hypothetical protein